MEIHIAIIGLGLRSTDVLCSMLKYRLGVKVSAVCDINRQKAEENLRKLGIEPDAVRFYTDADEMLDLQGKEESAAPIHEAAIANRMCLKARQSTETMTFEKIDS